MNNSRGCLSGAFFFCGVLFFVLNGCAYGSEHKNAKREARREVARVPINAEGGWPDSPFISRDGKRLYFMYSRYNFGKWIKSGGKQMPPLTGPDRKGLRHNDNPWDESDIYMAQRNPDGTWQEAVNIGLNGPRGDASGMEIDGGNTFVWLQGDGKTNNIVESKKMQDGTWSKSISLSPRINSHVDGEIPDNPYISADGNFIWFTSSRPGGMGGKDIWFSHRENGQWSEPVNVGAPINTDGDEDQFWISPVGLDVYWNGPKGIMHCVSNGSTCGGTPEIVSIPGCYIGAEVSMPDDGKEMFLACVDKGTFQIKIVHSTKQQDGSWGAAVPVD